MVEEGADVIDVGGESTRPGSQPVKAAVEIERVVPVIRELSRQINCPISIDTYKAPVAREAILAGATIVNDISGLRFDPNMSHLVKESGVKFVIMHIKGTPSDMQENPYYEDTVAEIYEYFARWLDELDSLGLNLSRAILDPGIGFGKRVSDNLIILKELDRFKSFGLPIMIGSSRKSFIGKLLNDIPPEERLPGSLASYAWAYFKGVDHLRVHDVRESVQFLKILEAIENAK
jgi:dihydropteroate synthase